MKIIKRIQRKRKAKKLRAYIDRAEVLLAEASAWLDRDDLTLEQTADVARYVQRIVTYLAHAWIDLALCSVED